jgi:ubiquinone/menaquinone biosynthesis C-methylase UbiE
MSPTDKALPPAALLALLTSCSAPAHHHGEHGMHKDFSDASQFAKSFDDPGRDAWQRPAEVIEHLRIEKGSVVVDLGAGTGYFLRWLSEATGPTGKVLALDVEPNMITFMQERAQKQALANVEPRRVAPDDPGLSPESVSRVLIVNTWHHIDERTAYAAKLARALEPTGEVLVVDYTLEAEHGPPAAYRLAPERVVSELEAGGLAAEIVAAESLPDQYVVRARRAPPSP